MMNRWARRVAPALAVAGLVMALAACGSSDGDGGAGGDGVITADEQPYVDAMVEAIGQDEATPFTDAQATCLAEGMVNAIGVDEFERQGIEPADLTSDSAPPLGEVSADKADALAKVVFGGGCLDFGELIAESMTQDTSFTLDKEKAQCLGDQMAKSSAFRKAFVQSITGDDTADPFSQINALKMLSDCGIDLGDLGGTTETTG